MEEKEQQEIDLTKVYDYAEYPDKVLSRPKSKKAIENKGGYILHMTNMYPPFNFRSINAPV
ncbi:hypothetical protein COK01_02070 [Priestia megaterium]|uniref:hypothetical protein n=1 Tax=Priestia megaterium TaxID=1404 RepID=UPI000BF74A08|nr:hypothetical protein [Priestia megaterium]PFP52017.1 hypothetical protein COK01_02070 [Priestia megaterium]